MNETIQLLLLACIKGFEPTIENLDITIDKDNKDLNYAIGTLSSKLDAVTSSSGFNRFDLKTAIRFGYDVKKENNVILVSIIGNKYETDKCNLNFIYSLIIGIVDNKMVSLKFETSTSYLNNPQLLCFRLICSIDNEISVEFFKSNITLIELSKRILNNLGNVSSNVFSTQCKLGWGGLETYSKNFPNDATP